MHLSLESDVEKDLGVRSVKTEGDIKTKPDT